MYSVLKFSIKKGSGYYEYCDSITKAANNLRNAVLFRMRQVLTFTEKPKEQWTSNEKEIHDEIEAALPYMNKRANKYVMPCVGNTFLSYNFMDALLKVIHNPDYCCHDLPRQSAQQIIKEVVASMKSFYAAVREYKAAPAKFTGRPKLPGYSKSGGNHAVVLTNQDCTLYKKGIDHSVKLPLCKQRFNIGAAPVEGKLKQASIVPMHGIFMLVLVFDDGITVPAKRETSRICAIDMGVNNIAAITNNVGKPCLLFKGGIAKSINQGYNKQMAQIMSKQTTGTTTKFAMTPEAEALCLKRNNRLSDLMHKTAKHIVQWCIDNEIDTIVIGKTKFWKQETNIGAKNNQNFVQIPFDKLRFDIAYRAERVGIKVVEQEESYTSVASFMAKDTIPVYGKNDSDAKFTGKRIRRGVYRNADGSEINADLNASANILRKAFPAAFEGPDVNFGDIIIIVHPDLEKVVALRNRQLAKKKTASKAKLRRQARKNK